MQWRIICSQVSFFHILKNTYGYAIKQEQVQKIQIIKKSEIKGPVQTHSRPEAIRSIMEPFKFYTGIIYYIRQYLILK